MYTHKLNQSKDEQEVISFIGQNGFGILVSTVKGKLWATHLPLVIDQEGKKLTGHLARANSQWKDFNGEDEVMVVFAGPHTYISSSWYDHENVPTWNYITAHVYGRVRITEGDELLNDLKDLTNKYEKASANPVRVENMSEKLLVPELRGIVGIQVEITRIESTFKLSQNRDDKNYKVITGELEKRGCPFDHEIAEEMKKRRPLDY